MKSIARAAVAAAVLFGVSAASFSAEATKKPPRASKPPVREVRTQPSEEVVSRSLPAQVVFQVLLGEIAMQRGNIDLAVDAYADLARRTRDPKVLERATELASFGRRFDVAYENCRLWLEVEPDSMMARQTLAAVLILQGRADELGVQLAYLLEKDRAHLADNLLRLNRMLARFPDKGVAYRMLVKVLAAYDGVAEAHYALATAAFHAGERDAALAQVRRAAALRPEWEQPPLFEAQLLVRDSATAAIEVLEKFLRENPGARDVRLHLARGLVADKRYADAMRHFRKLLADNPDSPELLYPVAILALQQNDLDMAEPMLKKVLARGEPSERDVAAFYLGQIAEDKGAAGDAIGYYRQVVAGEQFAPAQVRVASLLLKQGAGLAMARAHLQDSALRVPPAKTRLLLAEAQLLRDAGRFEDALALLDQALAQQPNEPDILYDAALLAERLGRIEVLERNLRRVIELRPDNAHAYNALGYSLADRGLRLEEARQLIGKAHEMAPDDPFIMDSMGWVLFKTGDLKGALDFLQRAYRIKSDAEIAAHLGEVLWLLDRKDEARRIWSDAAKRHPGNDVLEAVRKKYLP